LGYNFAITKQGNLYAKSANISGNITAESGQIGKWKIGTVKSENNGTWASGFTNSIWGTSSSDSERYYTILRTSEAPMNLAFSIKSEDSSGNATDIFYIRNNGSFYAQNAYL
jgi:hypothetical protein